VDAFVIAAASAAADALVFVTALAAPVEVDDASFCAAPCAATDDCALAFVVTSAAALVEPSVAVVVLPAD
jgi:hypothetical protein